MRADLRAKRPLLYQEVVNALYQIIDTSNLKPGDQMPAERELMEQLSYLGTAGNHYLPTGKRSFSARDSNQPIGRR